MTPQQMDMQPPSGSIEIAGVIILGDRHLSRAKINHS